MPKVAFDLLGKPLIRWVVDAAHEAGCDDVITVLGHRRDIVEPLVHDTSVVYQLEQLGTGHAVKMAADELSKRDGYVVVLSGDSPLIAASTIERLATSAQESGCSAIVLTHIAEDPYGYGRVIRDMVGNVTRIVEQKDCTEAEAAVDECNSGIYAFKISSLLSHLDELSTDNSQGEYYLTDVIAKMVSAKEKVGAIIVDDPIEASGINTRVQLAQASKFLQRRINREFMLAGVSMLDPDLVWIGPDVKIAADVDILPMTMLMGDTTIESGCIIGPNTRITDSYIGHDSTIDECVIIESIIDDNVACGPRAYLRPGTHMCSGSKAGTHVEIKKSTIGDGSKVPHLSYIGDAVIGSGVNIGAGSITCNYDGVNKHATTIGDRSFVGSNTMMVAPVNIGNDCTIGAGSVITDDVPDGSLGIGRSRQKNIDGYTEKKNGKNSE